MKKFIQKRIIAVLLIVFMLAPQAFSNCQQVYADDYSSAITISNSSKDVEVSLFRHSGGNHDWQEYGFSIKNKTRKTIEGITITVPTNGSVTAFQSWNVSAKYSQNKIIITYTKPIKSGETYRCGENDKFGFSGGGTLKTPSYELGVSNSASGLKYSVKGATKDLSASQTPVGKHGTLSVKKVSGYNAPTIVDKSGKAFQLRGTSTHGVQWFPQYINKAAFQSLRDEWGINMVRLAIYAREGGYTQDSASMDKKIEEGVEAAKALGMYVIVDWHVLSYNPNETINEAKSFFKKYASKYKNYNNVIFEICNEPTGTPWYTGSNNDLYTYCTQVTKVIRDNGSNAIVLCGTNTWSQDVDEVAKKPLSTAGFSNIMYSVHFYAATHYDNIKNKMRTALAAGTPVFVTEFGVCEASGNGALDTDNADDWIRLMKANNISYACWSLCNKGESASLISSSCSKTSKWTGTDLSDAGIWLVNTSRALADAESGSNSGNSDNSDNNDNQGNPGNNDNQGNPGNNDNQGNPGNNVTSDQMLIKNTKCACKSYNSVSITWNKVNGANGYEIAKLDGDYFATVKDTNTNSYVVSGLKTGKKYTFQVKAYKYVNNVKEYGTPVVISGKASLGQVKSLKVTNKSYKKPGLKWSKVSGANGYKITYSTKKSGVYTTIATIKSGSKVSATLKKLKKGKTYYFKVVAYRTVDKKAVNGKYSTIVSAKLK